MLSKPLGVPASGFVFTGAFCWLGPQGLLAVLQSLLARGSFLFIHSHPHQQKWDARFCKRGAKWYSLLGRLCSRLPRRRGVGFVEKGARCCCTSSDPLLFGTIFVRTSSVPAQAVLRTLLSRTGQTVGSEMSAVCSGRTEAECDLFEQPQQRAGTSMAR